MKFNSHLGTWIAAWIMVAACGFAQSAAAVTVTIEPADTTVCPGDEFEVRAVTTSFADLKGFSLIYQFDPNVVQLLGATPGDVLTSSANPFSALLVPDYAAPADSVYYDAAMLIGSTQGPGILAFFRFKALAAGVSLIDCRLVDFRDSQNVQTLPACVSGQVVVPVICATDVRRSSWGSVKTIYR